MVDVSEFHPGSRDGYDTTYKQTHLHPIPSLSGYGVGSFMKKHWGKVLLASAATSAAAAAAAGAHGYQQYKKRKLAEDEAEYASAEEAGEHAHNLMNIADMALQNSAEEEAGMSLDFYPVRRQAAIDSVVNGDYATWDKLDPESKVDVVRVLEYKIRHGDDPNNMYSALLEQYSPRLYNTVATNIRRGAPTEITIVEGLGIDSFMKKHWGKMAMAAAATAAATAAAAGAHSTYKKHSKYHQGLLRDKEEEDVRRLESVDYSRSLPQEKEWQRAARVKNMAERGVVSAYKQYKKEQPLLAEEMVDKMIDGLQRDPKYKKAHILEKLDRDWYDWVSMLLIQSLIFS